MGRVIMIFALLSVIGVPVYAGPNGRITVVDGDTIDVGGTRVRLFGIDAPEGDQTCTRPDGAVWACGTWATAQVRALYQGKR
ncbi:MAG: thermonuclease family protein, partial [Alphaproteobacteria bacterium]|nr:thermonuclease family protein [Alphaproteobacteria bacterium]